MIELFISLIIGIPTILLGIRYNLHMLQLNGYKNKEHFLWLKKNIRFQWLLVFDLILGLINLIFLLKWISITSLIFMGLTLIVYRAIRKMEVKKKLVYTSRVKRIILTTLVIIIGLLIGLILLFNIKHIVPIMLISISVTIIAPLMGNIINTPIEALVRKYYIEDGKKILRDNKDLIIIGVTGSYGKTSVKFYLETLLKDFYSTLVTPESFNTPMGVIRTIREKMKSTHEVFICEMGARNVGDIKELCEIVHPTHGIITSIGHQHLETFKSMENIIDTKFELAEYVKNGKLFLNGDSQYILEGLEKKEIENSIVYTVNTEGGEYKGGNIKVSKKGTSFIVKTPGGEEEEFNTSLVGEHNVINVLSAISVANFLGIPLMDLKIPVRRIKAVPHRMEMKTRGNVTIIDDAYNSNPVGSKAALDVLKLMEGERILITPGMVELGDKEYEYNRDFGEYAGESSDYIFLIGEKRTLPIKIGVELSGFNMKKCFVYNTLGEAINHAYSIKTDKHKYILLENDLPDNY